MRNEDTENDNIELEYKRNIFVPNYKLTALVLNKVINIKEDHIIHNYISYKILYHQLEDSYAEEDRYDLELLKNK